MTSIRNRNYIFLKLKNTTLKDLLSIIKKLLFKHYNHQTSPQTIQKLSKTFPPYLCFPVPVQNPGIIQLAGEKSKSIVY